MKKGPRGPFLCGAAGGSAAALAFPLALAFALTTRVGTAVGDARASRIATPGDDARTPARVRGPAVRGRADAAGAAARPGDDAAPVGIALRIRARARTARGRDALRAMRCGRTTRGRDALR